MSMPVHPLHAALDDLKQHVLEVAAATALAALVGLAATIGHLLHQRDVLRAENAQLALRSYNQAAALDTSRAVALSRADRDRLLGDSLQAVTRLALQEHQRATALDHALKLERQTTAGLQVQVAQLQVHTQSTAPVATDSAGARSASFHVRQMPWTMDASVVLQQGRPGAMDATVAIDAAQLVVTHSCEAPNRDGIRPARVVVTGPPWLTTTVTTASQDPAICQSPALVAAKPHKWVPSFRPQLAAGIGYSAVWLPDGSVRGGRAVWVGMTLVHWPRGT